MDRIHRCFEGRRLDKGPGGADAHHHERQDGELPGGWGVPHSRSPGGATNTVTIEYKTFGVGLNFTPTVLSNNKISMEVKPEVSELDFTNAVPCGLCRPEPDDAEGCHHDRAGRRAEFCHRGSAEGGPPRGRVQVPRSGRHPHPGRPVPEHLSTRRTRRNWSSS